MGIDAEMFAKTKVILSEDEVLNLAYRLGEAFYPDTFFIAKEKDKLGPAQHCLTIEEKIEQDGPDILPEKGEQFIRVHLFGRYYGIGYERGDLPKLISIAEWLEKNIKDCEIWYGGDSSGVLAKLFNKSARRRLWNYFCEVGHLPYLEDRGFMGSDEYGEQICDLCKKTRTRMGWGQNYAAYSCFGCGSRIVTRDHGITWQTEDEPK